MYNVHFYPFKRMFKPMKKSRNEKKNRKITPTPFVFHASKKK